jgi:hypothetical protein
MYTGIKKGKEKKNFFKEAQLARYLGEDFEKSIKDSVQG